MMLKRNSEVLFQNFVIVEGYWNRMMGLMGRDQLDEQQALFFDHCNWIHTCFMKFSIDCVFLDEKGVVKKIYHNIRPWRFAGPVWGAKSVIEMTAGLASKNNIQLGDHLLCGH